MDCGELSHGGLFAVPCGFVPRAGVYGVSRLGAHHPHLGVVRRRDPAASLTSGSPSRASEPVVHHAHGACSGARIRIDVLLESNGDGRACAGRTITTLSECLQNQGIGADFTGLLP
jgi:hypothetical protein